MKKRVMDKRYKNEQCGCRNIRIRFYVVVFCFMFLPMRSLISLTSIAYAGSEVGKIQKSTSDSESDSRKTNEDYIYQLRRSQISAVAGRNDQNDKERLKNLIKQIRSIELTVQKQTPDTVIESEQKQLPRPKIVIPEPVVTQEETEEKEEQQEEEIKEEIKTETHDEPLKNKTLEMLSDMSEDPEQLENPFELGEVLFLSGYLKEAAVFYQEALRRINANNINLAQERAWILFQIGNCLRNNDMPVAAQMYKQLISEFPNSPWTKMAQVQVDLIDWHQKEEPLELIASGDI